MVSILSPGVYVIEKDISTYPVTIGGSTVGVVGFATKGPTDKATLITSAENLVKTFGLPNSELTGQGLQGALEILEATNSLYFVRVAATSATEASAAIGFGACPAVAIKSGSYGVTANLDLLISGIDNNGNEIYPGGRLFSIPSGTVGTGQTQQAALLKVFGNALDSSPISVQFPTTVAGDGTITPGAISTEAGIIVLSDAGSVARLYVSGSVAAQVAVVSTADGSVGSYANSVVASGLGFDLTEYKFLAKSLYEGTGYNLTSVDGVTRGNSVEVKNLGGPNFTVTVNEDGGVYESYKANLLTGPNGLVKKISSDFDNPTSEVILGSIYRGAVEVTALTASSFTAVANQVLGGTAIAGKNARFIKLLARTEGLSGGLDGNSDDNAVVIGSATEKSGIYALDDDLLNLSIAVTPGLQTEAIQNELITLAQTTTNFIAVVAPPVFTTPTVQAAIDWSNGLSDARKSAINSSYAAIYWPNVKTFIPALGKDDWMDAAIYGARQIAYTANVSELWFAPAGFIRGRLTKPTETEVGLGQGDRDAMYSGGNVINPIVNFPQQGITIFGQRTAQREPSALDRINVRLLTIYLKKVLLRSVTRELFEPNDPILWDSVRTTATTVLEDIKLRRGITEYGVYCDESTNTPARIERNELWCKIVIKPTKTAEAIVFELNLASQSATIQ